VPELADDRSGVAGIDALVEHDQDHCAAWGDQQRADIAGVVEIAGLVQHAHVIVEYLAQHVGRTAQRQEAAQLGVRRTTQPLVRCHHPQQSRDVVSRGDCLAIVGLLGHARLRQAEAIHGLVERCPVYGAQQGVRSRVAADREQRGQRLAHRRCIAGRNAAFGLAFDRIGVDDLELRIKPQLAAIGPL